MRASTSPCSPRRRAAPVPTATYSTVWSWSAVNSSINTSRRPESLIDVVVANRMSASWDTLVPKQPDKLIEAKSNVANHARQSVKFHHVATFGVTARDAVPGPLRFGDFQHRTAHVALDFERVGSLGCLGFVERSAHVLGPTE